METLTVKLLWPKEIDLFYEILRGYAFHVQHVSDKTQGVDRGVDPYHKESWAMAEELMQYIEKEKEYVEIHRPTFPRERKVGVLLPTERRLRSEDSGEDS